MTKRRAFWNQDWTAYSHIGPKKPVNVPSVPRFPSITPTSVLTDEWFSYSPRGELTDVYESTPHSNGYYHLTAQYWEDRSLKTVSGILGLPTITYGGLDGEGRVKTVTASSGTNPVSAVAYNNGPGPDDSIGAVLTTTLGAGDTQNFTYDPNTGRMTSYSASVGATPTVISGSLTWSPNGTLRQNSISDGYNSADTQVCNYLYDDFIRVAGTTSTPGVNCLNGSTKVWNQTFNYDQFGNITKTSTGPGLSWACAACYNTANNQYNSTLSASIAYDAAGNLLNDTFHTYTWNAYGHVATIVTPPNGSTTSAVTYDANDNKVEENVGGTIREYISAFGVNAEMISSQEFTTTFDLPGGVQALYSPGGLQRFRFPDWQGSIRAESSSATRAFTESLAFAPFGERYAVAGAPYNVDSFTGKPDHLVSDEYDFPARQEHNGQGRWVSPDPMRGTGNKYVYADNNPLSKVDLYGLETVSIVMDGLDIGTTTLGEPEDMQLVITESHPPQSMQTSGNGSADNSQGGSDSSGLHFWQRIKNCFSGFCGMSDEEKAVWQKAVDTKIQNERKDVEKTCPFGCLGKTASDIKRMSPQEVDRFYEVVQFAAQFAALFYRGGASMEFRNIDVRIDPQTGLVQPGRGVSLNTEATGLEKFGGAYRVDPGSVSPELEIIQRGGNPSHFEIAPREPMTPGHYQELLNQVKVEPVNPSN